MPSPTARLENQCKNEGYSFIAGLDEAGKGAWAGPVVAAAVILPSMARLPKLNDSKLLSAPQREGLYHLIINQAIACGVGIKEAYLVDEIGLAEAHRQAMRQAVEKLKINPDLLLVDGCGIKQLGVKTRCIIKGDQKVRCIAAASIIAKVTRDRIMKDFHKEYPYYSFYQHKGYGTKVHQDAISKYGVCKIHRLSYLPVFSQWQGNLFSTIFK